MDWIKGRPMNPLRLLVPLLLSTLFAGPAFAVGKCERLIVTGSPDAPPYLWRDPHDPKHLMGANADLLKQAAQDIGIKVEFLYAGKRSQALDEVRSGRMDLLVDAPLLESELESLDYIHPAINQTLGLSAEVIAQPLPLNSLPMDNRDLYLALSFNSACNEPWLRGQLVKKMTELAASGVSADAVKHNLEVWKAQLLTSAAVPNK
jgi:ABC-type amino acid transport substrate-binding protein